MVSIEVYPYLSPRVIVIPAPDTEITVQQLHNLIRDWEDSDPGMSFDYIIDSAGKENLGGGVSVGITSTLQNAQIRFAARPVPLSSGTATSAGTRGETLTDTGADFSADGIYPGCTVVNSTTGAMETVITVGTTSLTSFSLQAGTRQDWQIGDEYDVFPNEQCSITGGNLVAIDENGDNISPVLQAPNVQVVRSSSSSATVADLDAIQYSSYQNAIWVDINTSNTGIDYPIGTREFPVNNIADAVDIANDKGFKALQILESMLIDSGTDIQSFRLIGQNSVQTEIELSDAVDCRDVTIENCTVTGVLDGGVQIRNCIVRDITYVNGHIHNSGLEGTIYLDGAEDALIANSYASSTVLPVIDMGGFGQNLSVVNYTGRIQLNNSLSPGNVAALGLNSGQVIINTDFTAGVIIISGIGAVINNGTPTALSTEGLMSKETISEAVLNTELADFSTAFTVASSLRLAAYENKVTVDTINGSSGTNYPIGTSDSPVDNLNDAVVIADSLGFDTIEFKTDYTFPNTIFISDLTLRGQGMTSTLFTFETGSVVANCRLKNVECTGFLTGVTGFEDCLINNLGSVGLVPSSQNIVIKDCLLGGLVSIPSNYSGTLKALNCWSDAAGNSLPTLDMGNSTADFIIRNYSGGVEIQNVTEDVEMTIELSAGQVVIDSSCTDGYLTIRGVGLLSDNSTGTMTVESDALMNKTIVSEAVLNTELAGFTVDATVASSLRFGAYGNVVTVDVDNGSPGTSYPIGTFESPVDNVQDASVLAAGLGIHTISFLSNYVFDNTVDVTGLHLSGHGMTDTRFTFEPGAKTFNCELLEAECTGVVDGVVAYYDCFLNSLEEAGSTPYDGRILVKDCLIHGDFKSPSNFSGVLQVLDCWSGTPGDTTPALDLNSNTANMAIRNYAGGLRLKNCTNPTQNSVAFSSGRVILDSSNTDGYFTVRGICAVVDELTGSAVLDTSALLNKELVSEAVWDETLADHTLADSTGEALLGITYDNRIFIDTVNGSAGTVHPIGTKKAPVDNFADALTLSTAYSINRFHIIGSLSISGGEDLSGYTFGADRSTGNVLIASNVITDFTYIEDLTVIMAQSGSARYTTSVLVDIDDFDGGAKDCLLVGDINVVGSGSNYFTNCDTYVTDDSVPVSIAVNDKKLNIIRGRGNYKITDKTGGPTTSIDLVAGYLEVDSTCTAGSIYISGVCDVIDNSGPGCTVVVRAIGNDSISDTVWDETRSSHNTAGTFGATDEWASAVDTDAVADAVWDEVRAGHVAAGTFGATDEWASAVDVESIADAVWEEPADEHEDVNTMGEKQNTGGTGSGDPEAIADAVWEEASDDHVDDGTMGQLQKKIDTLVAAKPKIVPGE